MLLLVDQYSKNINFKSQIIKFSMVVKVGLPPPTFPPYLFHSKPFKNDKESCLSHLKSSFRSQDI